MDYEPSGTNPQEEAVKNFLRTYSKELAAVGIFLAGNLTGYAIRARRAPSPEQPVMMASMITPPSAKPKGHHVAKAAPSKKSKLLAKADKPKSKEKSKRHRD